MSFILKEDNTSLLKETGEKLIIQTGSSPSASLSPSASRSPSSSLSPSASLSPSISPSSSRSPSSSVSSSPSASLSPSASVSASISPSPSLGYILYSRGDETVLPLTNTDLETLYSEGEEVLVSTRNDQGVSQEAAAQYMLHQYRVFVGEVEEVNIEWEGHSSLAPNMSAVYLQIYNQVTHAWETVAVNNSAHAEIDFELEARVRDVAPYLDQEMIISCRIYQLAI